MNCSEVKAMLSSYYDAELSSDDHERVAAHLKSCAECSMELAGFEALSGLVQRAPPPLPMQLGWQHFHLQLMGSARFDVTSRGLKIKRPVWLMWLRDQGLRSALGVAVILLIAVGWLASTTWFGHEKHDTLAADIGQYIEEFRRDPQAAEQMLLTRYDGEKVRLDEAVQRVGYRPVATGGLPEGYTVDSICVLKMPCCDCLQTVCQRRDGSKFAIFEYGDEHPISEGKRGSGMAHCRGKNCCLVQASDQFTVSWKKGARYISLVGVHDQAEIDTLVARLQ